MMILPLEEDCFNVYKKRWTEHENNTAGGIRGEEEARTALSASASALPASASVCRHRDYLRQVRTAHCSA
jgi:hypothetical protein